VGAIALGAALALTACSASAPSDSASGSGAPAVKELTVWAFDSKTPPKLKAGFAAAYPQYDLNIVQIPSTDIVQRLVVALQGGSGLPDVVQLSPRDAGGLVKTGQFLDMTAELNPVKNNFPEGVLVGNGDQLDTFTMGSANMGLWVNKAALAEHGLAIPANPTWDDIVDVAKKLKDASGGKQYLFIQPPGTNGFNYFNAFYQSRGGTWYDDDGNLTVNADLAADTLQFLTDLDKQGLVYHGLWTDPTWWDAIRNKTVVGWGMNFGVGSTNLQQNVPEQSGDWELVTWPKWSATDKQMTGAFGGSMYIGLKAAKNQQGAKDLLMWWLSDDGLKAQQDTLGIVSYNAPDNVIDQNKADPYFGGQQVIKDLSSVSYPPTNYLNWSQVTSAGTDAVDKAFAGDLSPKDAINAAIQELKSE
jgi:ABC-type glycerol-3-phosphate transport system substrate-binding protein